MPACWWCLLAKQGQHVASNLLWAQLTWQAIARRRQGPVVTLGGGAPAFYGRMRLQGTAGQGRVGSCHGVMWVSCFCEQGPGLILRALPQQEDVVPIRQGSLMLYVATHATGVPDRARPVSTWC